MRNHQGSTTVYLVPPCVKYCDFRKPQFQSHSKYSVNEPGPSHAFPREVSKVLKLAPASSAGGSSIALTGGISFPVRLILNNSNPKSNDAFIAFRGSVCNSLAVKN